MAFSSCCCVGVINLLANVLSCSACGLGHVSHVHLLFRLGHDGARGHPAGAGPAPERRGMASSLQMFIGSSSNGIVAGLISPLVMHSTIALAATSLALACIGLVAWLVIRRRWPEIGQHAAQH